MKFIQKGVVFDSDQNISVNSIHPVEPAEKVIQGIFDTSSIDLGEASIKATFEATEVDQTTSNSKFYLTCEIAYDIPDDYLGVDFDIPTYYTGHSNASDLYLQLVFDDDTDDVFYLPPGDSTATHPVSFADVVQIQKFLDTIVLPNYGLQARDAVWQVNKDLTVTLWFSPAALAASPALYFVGGSNIPNDYDGASYPAIPSEYPRKESKVMINTHPVPQTSGITSINGNSDSTMFISKVNNPTIAEGFVNAGPGEGLGLNTYEWNMLGNEGTDPVTNFIGTTDTVALNFKTGDTPAMQIDSKQNVIIGDYDTASVESAKLLIIQSGTDHMNGLGFQDGSRVASIVYDRNNNNLILYDDGSIYGYFDTATGIYSPISDKRLKENIVPITDSEKIYKLNPVNYNFIKDSSKPQKGFIAQEVAEIYPELVTGKETLALNIAGLVPMLVAEMQKLRAELDELKRK